MKGRKFDGVRKGLGAEDRLEGNARQESNQDISEPSLSRRLLFWECFLTRSFMAIKWP
jgi:hypothetical protein